MKKIEHKDKIESRSYRPQELICPGCQSILKRRHILWRKHIFQLENCIYVTSWAYGCPADHCINSKQVYRSAEAEGLHLKGRQFGRDVIVHIGYRRFWYHQTIDEIHDWITQDIEMTLSLRQVLNLIGDFLALLRAGQPAKIRKQLKQVQRLLIGVDGMQPEKGNSCLYIVRELNLGLTLLAENLDDSSDKTIRTRIFQPLNELAQEMNLSWHGVVSDAQESIRTAMAQEFSGVPYQTCQSHCLRKAGELTFNTDRNLKKRLKSTFRQPLKRLEQRIAQWSDTDPYRPLLADYADAMHSTLLEGGVAPFELGGLHIFDDLTALADSLARCRKKKIMYSFVASSRWLIIGCPLLNRSLNYVINDNG